MKRRRAQADIDSAPTNRASFLRQAKHDTMAHRRRAVWQQRSCHVDIIIPRWRREAASMVLVKASGGGHAAAFIHARRVVIFTGITASKISPKYPRA